jgi:DNA-directed RNA polymerase subunit M/transcription elongation factor TFIIS
MPIATTCQCGKTLNVKDELAGKAVKCPACQQIIKVPSSGAAPKQAAAPGAGAAKPGAAKQAAPRPAASGMPAKANTNAPSNVAAKAAPPKPGAMDELFEEAGFAVVTGKFCPSCSKLLQPGAILCTQCGYHLESGNKYDGHQSTFEDHDSGEAALRRAEVEIKRNRDAQERMEAAGMPPWMMAMVLFILSSCTAVAVTAVNVSRRSKDDTTTFNATATMLLLAGIAFSAVAIGSSCTVLYRAFKESPKQGMLTLLVPGYVFFYAFTRFKTVGKTFIVCLTTTGAAVGLFVLSAMSNEGKL